MQPMNTMDSAAMDRARYMSHMQRRSMPPRCNPFGIIFLVLAIGMVFIGLTMTVIAHWPGNSSIGENPLKIAGPVLLGFGLLGFVVGLALVCFWQSANLKSWQKTVQTAAMNKSVMQSAQSMQSQPQQSILKTPSGSTYGRDSEYGSEYNSQPGWQSGKMSYGEPEVNMGHEVYKIDTVQDGLQGRAPYPGGPLEQSSIDYGQNVPVPVRQTKPKKPRSQNQSYSSQMDEAASPNERNMRSYSTEGYDMYAGQGQEAPVPADRKKKHHKRSTEGLDDPKPKSRHHKEKTHTNSAYESDRVSPKQPGYYSNVPPTTGSYYSDQGSYDANPPAVYSGAGLTSPMSGAGGMGLAGAGGMGLAGSGGMGLSGFGATPGAEQQLKINIRAQPNTAVHITPKMYHAPPTQQQPYSRDLASSQASVETEI